MARLANPWLIHSKKIRSYGLLRRQQHSTSLSSPCLQLRSSHGRLSKLFITKTNASVLALEQYYCKMRSPSLISAKIYYLANWVNQPTRKNFGLLPKLYISGRLISVALISLSKSIATVLYFCSISNFTLLFSKNGYSTLIVRFSITKGSTTISQMPCQANSGTIFIPTLSSHS